MKPDFQSTEQKLGSSDPLAIVRGIAGALAGGVLGVVIFTLMVRYVGVYAMAIPGALVGLGGGYAARRRSLVLGILCAALAAAAMIVAEWWNFPWQKDESLWFFLRNLGQLSTLFWLSLLLGGGLSILVWSGKRANRFPRRIVVRVYAAGPLASAAPD